MNSRNGLLNREMEGMSSDHEECLEVSSSPPSMGPGVWVASGHADSGPPPSTLQKQSQVSSLNLMMFKSQRSYTDHDSFKIKSSKSDDDQVPSLMMIKSQSSYIDHSLKTRSHTAN